jgi:hypothetical protein
MVNNKKLTNFASDFSSVGIISRFVICDDVKTMPQSPMFWKKKIKFYDFTNYAYENVSVQL